MADPFSTLPPEVALEQAQISRQQQLANLLMQQGMQQPQGQMVSGRYVPPSIFQNLAGLANIYVGQKKLEESDKQRAELAQKLREGESKTVKEYFKALQGTPETQTEMAGPYTGDIPAPVLTQPATGPNYQQAFEIATNPYAPSWLKQQAVEQMKPQKLGEGEVLTRINPLTGKQETIAQGAEKFRAPIQIDTGTAIQIVDPKDPTKVIRTIPKSQMPTAGQVVETANGPMLVNTRTGEASPIMAGGQPLAPKLSAEQSKDITAINQQRSAINGALDLVKATPSAFSFGRGLAGKLPAGETLAGRTEKPEETEARAAVYNIVSKVINERAGAAQSAQEIARLNAFLPSEFDNAKQIERKLNGFNKYLDEQEKGTRVPTSVQSTKPQSNVFGSEADAQKAYNEGKLKKGQKIIINGVSGTWQ